MGIVAAAMMILLFTDKATEERQFDGRVTFMKRDKIPYGTFVAYDNLSQLFPNAEIAMESHRPGEWNLISEYDRRQALIVVSPTFVAEESDMENLLEFIRMGNDVFVSTMKVSFAVEKATKSDVYYPVDFAGGWRINDRDSLSVSLTIPSGSKREVYSYPGKKYDFWFYGYDTLTTTILGYNEDGKPDFIKLSAGAGHMYLHLAPAAFTNYFLLHGNNMAYYEKALSVISPNVKKIVWDGYYLEKGENRESDRKRSSWLTVFFRYRGLRWALITAMVALLIYVLMEMRRRQRVIPVIHPPKNDSLDFVKTIGRLYHDKGDHRNLCNKMAAYFLEHVRTRYKLGTGELNEDFIKNLGYKTGLEESSIRGIVEFIHRLQTYGPVSADDLVSFHKQLESFYKTA